MRQNPKPVEEQPATSPLKTYAPAIWSAAGTVAVCAVFLLMRTPQEPDPKLPDFSSPAAAEASTAGPAVTVPIAPNTSALKAEVSELYATFTELTAPCNRAADAAEGFKGDNEAEAYTAFKAASEACLDSGAGLQKLEPPASASESVRAQFKAALSDCSGAYSAQWDAYRQIAKLIDGDDRPSKRAEAGHALSIAHAGLVQCIPPLMILLKTSGAPVPD